METPRQPVKKNQVNPNAAKILWIGIGILALIFLIAGLSPQPSKTASSSQSAPAAAQSQPSTKQQVIDWNNKYGAVIQALQSDLSSITKDSGSQNLSAIGSDCQQLQDDVKTGQSEPAIPDAQAAADWSGALSAYSSGATDCVNGANAADASLITRAAGEFNQGTDYITKTTADIQQLSNQ